MPNINPKLFELIGARVPPTTLMVDAVICIPAILLLIPMADCKPEY